MKRCLIDQYCAILSLVFTQTEKKIIVNTTMSKLLYNDYNLNNTIKTQYRANIGPI